MRNSELLGERKGDQQDSDNGSLIIPYCKCRVRTESGSHQPQSICICVI